MFAIAFAATLLFVPLDDRPVTRQLPKMLGQIAGVQVQEPPPSLLGTYFVPGQPDAIIAWLNATAQREPADSYALSSDMLGYGGLVASRTPATTYQDAAMRMRVLTQLRGAHPTAHIDVFGTIMRLAPTGVPAIGDAAHVFAAFPVWQYIQAYANLDDPPLPSEEAQAEQLRALIGEPVLQQYLAARSRDYSIDDTLIRLASTGVVNALVLGQDDAGVAGLHVKEVRALEQAAGANVSIEPGADELGMAFVAAALARRAAWTPRIAVRYYGTGVQDPREFATIPATIDALIRTCGAIHDDRVPDIVLYVRLPGETPSSDAQLFAAMQTGENANLSVAFADLTFLDDDYIAQSAFAQRILDAGIATRLDAYASWNTDANTVGTALAEAIAAGAGRRTGTYNALSHHEFTFMRFLDDVFFHDVVRPQLNAMLDARGITDHTYLLPAVAGSTARVNDALLQQHAPGLLKQLYPDLHIEEMRTSLPWNRTFETEIEVRLASAPP